MIAARRLQRSFADGLIAEAVEDLWEPWMRYADKALEDEALLLIIQQALAKRCKKSKTRGRPAFPAEVVLRLLADAGRGRNRRQIEFNVTDLRSTDIETALEEGNLDRLHDGRDGQRDESGD